MSISETELTRRRYERIAPVYDAIEWIMEWRARSWRSDLWSRVGSGRILELGVGTGKNIPYYPSGSPIVALDISAKMLARARRRAERQGTEIQFELGDVQDLPYGSGSFDCVVATFLFCSVPDPARGLAEARRVLVPGGKLLMLEHVLSEWPLLRPLMRWLDPLPAHLWGAHIDRDTVGYVRGAGFKEIRVENLSLDVVKLVEAEA